MESPPAPPLAATNHRCGSVFVGIVVFLGVLIGVVPHLTAGVILYVTLILIYLSKTLANDPPPPPPHPDGASVWTELPVISDQAVGA